jgi:dATP pyrophosphohydrolase
MPAALIRVVDVYPYRLVDESKPEFLLLRRAGGRIYAGEWRVIGGKIEAGESSWKAALRELSEETGLAPVRFWSIPSVNAFYEWEHDRINLIPAFAAQIDAEPALNEEHDGFGWFEATVALQRLKWPEQRRLLQLAEQILYSGIPPELVVPHR